MVFGRPERQTPPSRLSRRQACKGEDLGKVEFDEEIKKRFKMVYVPNWFSVDLKTGVSPAATDPLPPSASAAFKPPSLVPTDADHHAGRERLLRRLGVGEGRGVLQRRRIRPKV